MTQAIEARKDHDLRRRAWRWHFIAAALVIPFVLWQSITGTLYLWSEAWVDQRHPELRFVAAGTQAATLDAQTTLAREYAGGAKIANVRVSGDAKRSTQFVFVDAHGLPFAVFVDPWRGHLLGSLEGSAWPVGWSRSLHGGWPLGDAGSWLLEIGASWTIVMVLTGLYLWWPRDGRGLRALVPRLRRGGWTFWRDLHACVAVWFSLLIVLFLMTALPWTSFWGGSLLQPLQQMLGQETPRAAGFAPVMVGDGGGSVGSLQQMLEAARARGMHGDLLFYMIDGPPGSAVSVRDMKARSSDERYLLLDRRDARVIEEAGWAQFPLIARAVATGVDIHEAGYFGRLGAWVNTVFASALVWLSITGLMAWWRRKPSGSLGTPPSPRTRWPRWLKIAAVVSFLALPLLGLSAALLWAAETAWSRLMPQRT